MTSQQRRVLAIAVLASFVSFLDGSIVNVALPAIADDFGGGLRLQQWIVNAYFLTLGSFMLLAGSLSDIFGRRRILTAGLVGFGLTSLLCAMAPSGAFLIGARALQDHGRVAGTVVHRAPSLHWRRGIRCWNLEFRLPARGPYSVINCGIELIRSTIRREKDGIRAPTRRAGYLTFRGLSLTPTPKQPLLRRPLCTAPRN